MALKVNVDLGALQAQFQGLQGRHPGLWPALPKMALLAGLFGAVLTLAWLAYGRGQLEALETGKSREQQLRAKFMDNAKQAVNLEPLRRQKEQVAQFVGQLEKQLPSKAEMDALLSDINRAGVGRGLQFELFKPGQVVVRDYYAELPISVRLTGSYHDLGAFTGDIANLPRIVTLNNVSLLASEKGGAQIVLEATAKTFRYLDEDEIAAHRAAAAKANPPGKK